MKSFTHILLVALMLGPSVASGATPLSGTAGSNLTAYNPGFGAINNNEWNAMMNGRTGTGTAAPADFGNCNSIVLRCASPKCANGGCTSIDVATPIVAGCVASNAACKQYGDDLTQYIAAQLVANSTAKVNAQMIEAQSAANAAAAEQSAMQMQQMQAQMQQMQQQMANQNAQQIAQLQSALEEQQRATENALAQATAASTAASNARAAAQNTANTGATVQPAGGTSSGGSTVMDGLTEAQRIAANAGVSADILAREQIAGQILTYLENAQVDMNKAKAAMQDAFAYAGCDSRGDNCTGPKRVSVFRQKAMAFFEPYNSVLDDVYNALELAQTVGVDITDIYMMLNGSCNTWGEFLCNDGKGPDGQWAKYDNKSCPNNGGKSVRYGFSRGQNNECYQGGTIPPEDSTACTMNRALTDMEEVQRNFLFADSGDMDENVRIGCISSVLQNSKFFRNRRSSQAMIDIETLQRIISQDAPAYSGGNKYLTSTGDDNTNKLKYCALTPNGYMELERAVSTKKLPARICVRDEALTYTWQSQGQISASTSDTILSKGYGVGGSNPDYTNESACKIAKGEMDGTRCVCKSGVWNNGVCEPFSISLSGSGYSSISDSNCKNNLKGTPRDGKCYCGNQVITIGCCVQTTLGPRVDMMSSCK